MTVRPVGYSNNLTGSYGIPGQDQGEGQAAIPVVTQTDEYTPQDNGKPLDEQYQDISDEALESDAWNTRGKVATFFLGSNAPSKDVKLAILQTSQAASLEMLDKLNKK